MLKTVRYTSHISKYLKTLRFYSTGSKRLIIEPLSSYLHEPTKIFGEGFNANEKLTITGRLNCKEEDFDYTSVAHINTDDRGCFDLSNTPSVGGTYTGVEQMGLFWSMSSSNHQLPNFSNGAQRLNYKFSVFEGHQDLHDDSLSTIENSVERYLVADGIQRKEICSDGIKGTLYIPEGNGPFAAAITIHGGVKKKHVIEDYAAFLASKGIVTLALAFFGVKDMPSSYTTQPIDIEYFEKAMNYLQSLDCVSNGNVGVVGFSKGAEIALAMSSFLPQLKFCCLLNTYVGSIGTPTVYKGEKVEKCQEIFENVKFFSENLVDISECLINPREQPEAIHPFTRSNVDTLLIVGEKDLNWRSSLCADIFKERMKEAGKSNFNIVRYSNIGHFVDIPNCPIITSSAHPLLPKGMLVSFGGSDNLSGYAADTVSAWGEVLRFLDNHKPH